MTILGKPQALHIKTGYKYLIGKPFGKEQPFVKKLITSLEIKEGEHGWSVDVISVDHGAAFKKDLFVYLEEFGIAYDSQKYGQKY